MKNRTTANYAKVAVVVVALAVAVSCTFAGTLAAFSATYTWDSDQATAGETEFRDTTYTIDLFDDGVILPGDSGSAPLAGQDFGDLSPVWTFSVSNESGIPVIFYLTSAEGKTEEGSFFSDYAFPGMDALFVKTPEGESVKVADVSRDPVDIAAKLAVGVLLCWLWPSEFYSDAECLIRAENAATATYEEYCLALCSAGCAFPEGFAVEAGARTVNAFATGGDEDSFTVRQFPLAEAYAEVREGVLYMNDVAVSVEENGVFRTPASSDDLTEDCAVWLLVPEDSSTGFESLLDGAVRYEKGGLYSLSAYGGDADASSDPSGNRRLYKLYPEGSGERASLSVSVTASIAF